METTTLNQIFFNWTLKLLITLIKRTLVRAQIKKRTLVFTSDKFSCAPPQRPLAGPEPTTTATTTPTIFRSTRTTDPLWQYCRPRVSRWNDPRSWWLLVIYSVILPRTFRSLSLAHYCCEGCQKIGREFYRRANVNDGHHPLLQ